MLWGEPEFSLVLLGGYLGLLSLFWGGLAASVGQWQRRFALPEEAPTGGLPLISVCIPARNEAHQIGPCVAAALAQDHPLVEVVVVDDGSTDGTADVARAAGRGSARLRVLQGEEALPPGWAGKPWACSRAAAAAQGSLLLFVDADVVLAPNAARRAAEVLLARKLSLVSLFGTWRLESFWEQACIPTIGWFIRAGTDLAAVNNPARPEAFANGQFILVDGRAYDALGGHGAVQGRVLEDVFLAKAFKQRGHAIGAFYAPWAFEVRLYRSLSEIIAGYTKNFYEGLERRPHIVASILLFLLLFSLLPYLLLPVLLLWPDFLLLEVAHPARWQAWAGGVCLLPLVFRYRVERADGRSGAIAWAHPLSNLVLAWILARSALSLQTRWKDRTFVDGRAAGS